MGLIVSRDGVARGCWLLVISFLCFLLIPMVKAQEASENTAEVEITVPFSLTWSSYDTTTDREFKDSVDQSIQVELVRVTEGYIELAFYGEAREPKWNWTTFYAERGTDRVFVGIEAFGKDPKEGWRISKVWNYLTNNWTTQAGEVIGRHENIIYMHEWKPQAENNIFKELWFFGDDYSSEDHPGWRGKIRVKALLVKGPPYGGPGWAGTGQYEEAEGSITLPFSITWDEHVKGDWDFAGPAAMTIDIDTYRGPYGSLIVQFQGKAWENKSDWTEFHAGWITIPPDAPDFVYLSPANFGLEPTRGWEIWEVYSYKLKEYVDPPATIASFTDPSVGGGTWSHHYNVGDGAFEELYLYGDGDRNDGPGWRGKAVIKVKLRRELLRDVGPPSTPSKPTGDTSLTICTSGTFSATGSDPQGSKICFLWDWDGDGRADENSGWKASGATDSRTHHWSTPGTYLVRVKLVDEYGNESGWSEALTVTVAGDTQPPSSYVKAISPYWQTYPFKITAEASDDCTGVKQVELFYRFSLDKSAWSEWVSLGVDTSAPWSWDFTAPKGYGFYEFYSVATDRAGNQESKVRADTSCGFAPKEVMEAEANAYSEACKIIDGIREELLRLLGKAGDIDATVFDAVAKDILQLPEDKILGEIPSNYTRDVIFSLAENVLNILTTKGSRGVAEAIDTTAFKENLKRVHSDFQTNPFQRFNVGADLGEICKRFENSKTAMLKEELFLEKVRDWVGKIQTVEKATWWIRWGMRAALVGAIVVNIIWTKGAATEFVLPYWKAAEFGTDVAYNISDSAKAFVVASHCTEARVAYRNISGIYTYVTRKAREAMETGRWPWPTLRVLEIFIPENAYLYEDDNLHLKIQNSSDLKVEVIPLVKAFTPDNLTITVPCEPVPFNPRETKEVVLPDVCDLPSSQTEVRQRVGLWKISVGISYGEPGYTSPIDWIVENRMVNVKETSKPIVGVKEFVHYFPKVYLSYKVTVRAVNHTESFLENVVIQSRIPEGVSTDLVEVLTGPAEIQGGTIRWVRNFKPREVADFQYMVHVDWDRLLVPPPVASYTDPLTGERIEVRGNGGLGLRGVPTLEFVGVDMPSSVEPGETFWVKAQATVIGDQEARDVYFFVVPGEVEVLTDNVVRVGTVKPGELCEASWLMRAPTRLDGHLIGFYVVSSNVGSDELLRTLYTLDLTPPVSSLAQIEPHWQRRVPFKVKAQAKDDFTGVRDVTLWYRYSPDNTTWTYWIPFEVDNEEPWDWWFTAPEGDGYYELCTSARDRAGNSEPPPEPSIPFPVGAKLMDCVTDGDTMAWIYFEGGRKKVDIYSRTSMKKLATIDVGPETFYERRMLALRGGVLATYTGTEVRIYSSPTWSLTRTLPMPGTARGVILGEGSSGGLLAAAWGRYELIDGYLGYVYYVDVYSTVDWCLQARLGPFRGFSDSENDDFVFADGFLVISHPSVSLYSTKTWSHVLDLPASGFLAFARTRWGNFLAAGSTVFSTADWKTVATLPVGEYPEFGKSQWGDCLLLGVVGRPSLEPAKVTVYSIPDWSKKAEFTLSGFNLPAPRFIETPFDNLLLVFDRFGGCEFFSLQYYGVPPRPIVSCAVDATKPVSRVLPVEPYWRNANLVPFDVTIECSDPTPPNGAVPSGLGRVELWYRYSPDNLNWKDWRLYACENLGGLENSTSWMFKATEGDGYYEFYSIAIDVAGNEESPPEQADARVAVDTVSPVSRVLPIEPYWKNAKSVPFRVTASAYDTYSFVYDFSQNAGIDRWAWQANWVQTPANVGTPASFEDYSAIAKSDNKRWETNLATEEGQYNTQMFIFKIEQPKSSVIKIEISWEGFGNYPYEYDITLLAWNYASKDWEVLDQKDVMEQEGFLGGEIREAGDFISENGKLAIMVRSTHHVPGWHSSLFTDYLRVRVITYAVPDGLSGVKGVELFYRFSPDNQRWSEWISYGVDESASDGWSWDFHTENDGYYEFYTIATDRAGNVEEPPEIPDASCGVDTVPPSSEVAPVVPYWRNAENVPFRISAVAEDPIPPSGAKPSGIKSVSLWYRFSLDNATWSEWRLYGCDIDPLDGWSWDFVLGSHGENDGYYQFYTVSEDFAGNEEQPPERPDTGCGVDTLPPSSEVCEITPYWKNMRLVPFNVSAMAEDTVPPNGAVPSGVKEVRLYYRYSPDNLTWGEWKLYDCLGPNGPEPELLKEVLENLRTFVFENQLYKEAPENSPLSWLFSPKEGDGYYQFMSVAMDFSGNNEEPPEAPDAYCGVDTLPPVSRVQPLEPYWLNRNSPPLRPSSVADDPIPSNGAVPSGLASVALWYRYSLDNENWEDWKLLGVDENMADGWNWVFDPPRDGSWDGYYEFCSVATDVAGNVERAVEELPIWDNFDYFDAGWTYAYNAKIEGGYAIIPTHTCRPWACGAICGLKEPWVVPFTVEFKVRCDYRRLAYGYWSINLMNFELTQLGTNRIFVLQCPDVIWVNFATGYSKVVWMDSWAICYLTQTWTQLSPDYFDTWRVIRILNNGREVRFYFDGRLMAVLPNWISTYPRVDLAATSVVCNDFTLYFDWVRFSPTAAPELPRLQPQARCAVDTISPVSSVDPLAYWQLSVPFEITASAQDPVPPSGAVPSGLARVKLYYRHSWDNETWSDWVLFATDNSAPWSWEFDAPAGYGFYQVYTTSEDIAGNLEEPPEKPDQEFCVVIPATIDIDPDTLNIRSRGRWITCYTELPIAYPPENIAISSVALEGENLFQPILQAEPWPTGIGNHDNDGIPDLMVKFSRAKVENLVKVGDNITLTVFGLWGRIPFRGSDNIRVINPGNPQKLTVIAKRWVPRRPEAPKKPEAPPGLERKGFTPPGQGGTPPGQERRSETPAENRRGKPENRGEGGTVVVTENENLLLGVGEKFDFYFDKGEADENRVRNIQIKAVLEGDVLYGLWVFVENEIELPTPQLSFLEVREDNRALKLMDLGRENFWAIRKYLSGEGHAIELLIYDENLRTTYSSSENLIWAEKDWEVVLKITSRRGSAVVTEKTKERPITERGELASPYSLGIELPFAPSVPVYDDFENIDASKWLAWGSVKAENGLAVFCTEPTYNNVSVGSLMSQTQFRSPFTFETKMKLKRGYVTWIDFCFSGYNFRVSGILAAMERWGYGWWVIYAYRYDVGRYLHYSGSASLDWVENWHIFTFTDDGSYFKAYLDGTLVFAAEDITKGEPFWVGYIGVSYWTPPLGVAYVDWLKYAPKALVPAVVPAIEENLELENGRWRLVYNCTLKTDNEISDPEHEFYLTKDQWRDLLEKCYITFSNGSIRELRVDRLEVKVIYAASGKGPKKSK